MHAPEGRVDESSQGPRDVASSFCRQKTRDDDSRRWVNLNDLVEYVVVRLYVPHFTSLVALGKKERGCCAGKFLFTYLRFLSVPCCQARLPRNVSLFWTFK